MGQSLLVQMRCVFRFSTTKAALQAATSPSVFLYFILTIHEGEGEMKGPNRLGVVTDYNVNWIQSKFMKYR